VLAVLRVGLVPGACVLFVGVAVGCVIGHHTYSRLRVNRRLNDRTLVIGQ
jgi:hypothetical protein